MQSAALFDCDLAHVDLYEERFHDGFVITLVGINTALCWNDDAVDIPWVS
jgi:hypothetical protein